MKVLMKTRAQQKEETQQIIVEAAIRIFSDYGFGGASTRDIAREAGVNQGLLTYHFRSKEDLWKAAADKIFGGLRDAMDATRREMTGPPRPQIRRELTKTYVRYAAARPELFRFLVEEGKHPDERMRWLVDTHLKPFYAAFVEFGDMSEELAPHTFYALAGAASVFFAVAPECQRLTGVNPLSKQAIETHAEFVVNLMMP